MRCLYNELTSFVLLIIICHLREHNKGHNHGYSERARREGRMKANKEQKVSFGLNLSHLPAENYQEASRRRYFTSCF